jgi:hypothetical protein
VKVKIVTIQHPEFNAKHVNLQRNTCVASYLVFQRVPGGVPGVPGRVPGVPGGVPAFTDTPNFVNF